MTPGVRVPLNNEYKLHPYKEGCSWHSMQTAAFSLEKRDLLVFSDKSIAFAGRVNSAGTVHVHKIKLLHIFLHGALFCSEMKTEPWSLMCLVPKCLMMGLSYPIVTWQVGSREWWVLQTCFTTQRVPVILSGVLGVLFFVDVTFSLEAFRTCPQDNRDLSEQARRRPQEMIKSPILLVQVQIDLSLPPRHFSNW